MHVHNVNDFSPLGYQLSQTLYEGGATKHVFAATAPGLPVLICECTPQTPEDERAALEAFQKLHTPRLASESAEVSEAPVTAAKPARKRS